MTALGRVQLKRVARAAHIAVADAPAAREPLSLEFSRPAPRVEGARPQATPRSGSPIKDAIIQWLEQQL